METMCLRTDNQQRRTTVRECPLDRKGTSVIVQLLDAEGVLL
jgi:hypothetical protein